MTSELFTQCATHIRDHGWLQNRLKLRNDDGTVIGCAVGTIDLMVMGKDSKGVWRIPSASETMVEALVTFAQVIGWKELHRTSYPEVFAADYIAVWNDGRTQTRENVACAFELAAVLAEQRQAQKACVGPAQDACEQPVLV